MCVPMSLSNPFEGECYNQPSSSQSSYFNFPSSLWKSSSSDHLSSRMNSAGADEKDLVIEMVDLGHGLTVEASGLPGSIHNGSPTPTKFRDLQSTDTAVNETIFGSRATNESMFICPGPSQIDQETMDLKKKKTSPPSSVKAIRYDLFLKRAWVSGKFKQGMRALQALKPNLSEIIRQRTNNTQIRSAKSPPPPPPGSSKRIRTLDAMVLAIEAENRDDNQEVLEMIRLMFSAKIQLARKSRLDGRSRTLSGPRNETREQTIARVRQARSNPRMSSLRIEIEG